MACLNLARPVSGHGARRLRPVSLIALGALAGTLLGSGSAHADLTGIFAEGLDTDTGYVTGVNGATDIAWSGDRAVITTKNGTVFLGLIEIKENGIKKFVQKISTAYTMYFNTKYDHSGTIFQGRYKYKHVNMDDYLRYLIEYIHLNPYGIEEPNINKYAKNDNLVEAIRYSKEYEYSSFKDYNGVNRPQNNILVIRGPNLV